MTQIKNPETEVPKDMEKNYVIAMSEASNENLYNAHKESFLNLADMQRKVYELMFQNGWYKLETAENEKIQKKYQTLNQELNDLKQ